MFRNYLSLLAGVLVLICFAGLTGQAQAQHGRGVVRPGMVTPMNRFGGFDPRFMDPRLRGTAFGIDPRIVDPRLRERSLEIDRLLLQQRRPAFDSGLDRRGLMPGFGTNFDRRLLEPGLRDRNAILDRRLMTPLMLGF